MKAAEVRTQIASGETAPLYLLEGDDLQSRHDLALEFASMVDEGLEAFNVEHFYANEATAVSARDQLIGALLSTARTLPMMAPRRVVVLHEAERLLSPRKARDEEEPDGAPAAIRARKSRAPTPLEEFETYLASPEPLTTMIFIAGPLDANRRLVKVVRKHAIAVDCGTLDTPADAARWIRDRLAKDRMAVEPSAVALLLEGTGLDLGRVRAEIDKLALYAAGESTVTARHVRDLVVPQNEPGADFALGRAIWNGDAAQALREVAAQLDAGGQPPLILGQIRAAVGRLRPDSRIKSGLDAVLLTDLAIKSSAGDPQFLLERLVVELCAAGGSSRSSWQRR